MSSHGRDRPTADRALIRVDMGGRRPTYHITTASTSARSKRKSPRSHARPIGIHTFRQAVDDSAFDGSRFRVAPDMHGPIPDQKYRAAAAAVTDATSSADPCRGLLPKILARSRISRSTTRMTEAFAAIARETATAARRNKSPRLHKDRVENMRTRSKDFRSARYESRLRD